MALSTTTIGILLGLGSAFFNSCSYLGSRRFVIGRTHGTLRLLVAGHLLMGAAAVIVAAATWSPDMPPAPQYLRPAAAATVFYLLGQAGLFLLMRTAQASRVAPLLGFKVVVLALVVTAFGVDRLHTLQWLAVATAAVAAVMLGSLGGLLNPRAIFFLLWTCVGYSLSDLNITALVRSLGEVSTARASAFGCAVAYMLAGLFVLPLAPFLGLKQTLRDMPGATLFAAFWFTAMFCLFGAFATIGPVFGNVLQSTRGMMSILIGTAIARLGHHHLETRTPPGLLVRRILAAALMTLAIYLFSTAR